MTCDFKARALGPDHVHPEYDLHRCFDIGWRAGFRGPWCIEHGHADLRRWIEDHLWLRDQLRTWIKASPPSGK